MSVEAEELAAYYARKYPLTFTGDLLDADASLAERYQKGWEVARTAARLLREAYGAQKVVVFGSLADPSRFTRWSDVDLAAWGIPDDRFYAAVAEVTGLSEDFKVDLVDAEDCRDSLRKTVEDEGIEV